MNRRNFLGWSAAGITGFLVPKVIKPRVSTFVMGGGLRRRATYFEVYSGSPPQTAWAPSTGMLLARFPLAACEAASGGKIAFRGHGQSIATGTPGYARIDGDLMRFQALASVTGPEKPLKPGVTFGGPIVAGVFVEVDGFLGEEASAF